MMLFHKVRKLKHKEKLSQSKVVGSDTGMYFQIQFSTDKGKVTMDELCICFEGWS